MAESGDLVLLHGLEKSGLCLGWRPVNLVRKKQVREDGPLDIFKLPLPCDRTFLDDVRSCNVGRHQIRGELDSAEGEIHALTDARHEQGLSQPGHTHQ